MTVACDCSVHTPFGYIPPRLSGCVAPDDNITIYHTVNLAVLQSFFDEEHLGSLLGDTLLQQPLAVDLPTIRIFKTNTTSQLTKDSLLSAESESYSPYFPTSWTNWTSLTYYLSLLLAILAVIGVLFLFYHVKLLATAITTMHVTAKTARYINVLNIY